MYEAKRKKNGNFYRQIINIYALNRLNTVKLKIDDVDQKWLDYRNWRR